MKSIGKKVAAGILAAAICTGTGVVASAAAGEYDVLVQNKTIVLTKDGVSYKPLALKSDDIKLQLNEDGKLVLIYTNEDGNRRGVSLGTQNSVTINGEMTALTLDASLRDKVNVTLGEGSNVDTVTVSSKNNVEIQGGVNLLFITGSAKVNVTGEAEVNRAKVESSTAKLIVDKSATVSRAITPSDSNVKGVKKRSVVNDEDDNSGKYGVRLDVDGPIEVRVGDYDRNITIDDLNVSLRDYVDAYGYDDDNDRREISGHYDWTDADKKIFDHRNPRSGSYTGRFKFTPSSSRYSTVTDSITIKVVYTGSEDSGSGSSDLLKPTKK